MNLHNISQHIDLAIFVNKLRKTLTNTSDLTSMATLQHNLSGVVSFYESTLAG